MKLSYRGTPYDKTLTNPVLQSPEPTPPEPALVQKAAYPRHVAQTYPQNVRKYRGITYQAPNYSPEDYLNLCPTLNFCQSPETVPMDIDQQHRHHLLQNLERRIQAAQEAGNEMLVNLLQQEYQQLSLG